MNGMIWTRASNLAAKLVLVVALGFNTGAAQTIPPSAHEASRAWAAIEAKGTGLYVGERFLFAVAEFPRGTNPRRDEARAALITNRLLVNHFLLEGTEDTERKKAARILLGEPSIASSVRNSVRLSAHVLENGRKFTNPEMFRRVVAVRSDQEAEQNLSTSISEEAYSGLVSTLVQNWLNHPQIFEELGLHSLGLIARRHQLSQSVNTINLMAPMGDPIALRYEYQAYLEEGRFDIASLSRWPGEYQVTSKQVDLAGSDQLTALAWDSISCLDSRSKFADSYRSWASISTVEDVSGVNTGYVVQRALRCHGFIGLDEQFSNEAPEFFSELERVFREGRDLQAALHLAHRAVESSPRFAPSWGYLGAAYQASGNNEFALIFARARLSLEPTSKEALRMYLSLAEVEERNNGTQFASDLKLAVTN